MQAINLKIKNFDKLKKFDEVIKTKLIEAGYTQFIELYKKKYSNRNNINSITDIIVNDTINNIIDKLILK